MPCSRSASARLLLPQRCKMLKSLSRCATILFMNDADSTQARCRCRQGGRYHSSKSAMTGRRSARAPTILHARRGRADAHHAAMPRRCADSSPSRHGIETPASSSAFQSRRPYAHQYQHSATAVMFSREADVGDARALNDVLFGSHHSRARDSTMNTKKAKSAAIGGSVAPATMGSRCRSPVSHHCRSPIISIEYAEAVEDNVAVKGVARPTLFLVAFFHAPAQSSGRSPYSRYRPP